MKSFEKILKIVNNNMNCLRRLLTISKIDVLSTFIVVLHRFHRKNYSLARTFFSKSAKLTVLFVFADSIALTAQ